VDKPVSTHSKFEGKFIVGHKFKKHVINYC